METELMDMIRAINAQNVMEVHEFTAVLDGRHAPETVGFFFEIVGDAKGTIMATFYDLDAQCSYDLDLNAELCKQKVLEAFLAMHSDHQDLMNIGAMRSPTIRIVKPGTFMEYRRWRVDDTGVGINQVKVPVVMWNPRALEWMAERVVREL